MPGLERLLKFDFIQAIFGIIDDTVIRGNGVGLVILPFDARDQFQTRNRWEAL
jgi:hypothetical protein